MQLKKVVIISGAGSLIPWGAPSTKEITKTICEDRDFVTVDGEPFGNYLYNYLKLVIKKRNYVEINFESIMYLAELILNYYEHNEFTSYPNLIFNIKKNFINQINKFEKIYLTYKFKEWFHISNISNTSFLGKQYGERGVFIGFIRRSHKLVCDLVNRYSSINNYKKHSILNEKLKNFFNDLNLLYKIRYNTLNYDNLPVDVSGIDFFDGFDLKLNTDSSDYLRSQSKKIKNKYIKEIRLFNYKKFYSDKYLNSYFNLHGSFNYHIFPVDNYFQLVKNKFRTTSGELASFNTTQEDFHIMNTNIISGLNKAQKIFYEPFSHFYSRFKIDAINSKFIICIGYSFSDLHINDAIINSMRINTNSKLFLVNHPLMSESDLKIYLSELLGKTLLGTILRTPHRKSKLYEMKGEWFVFCKRLWIYKNGYEVFLKKKEWEIFL